jgi:hypothetical protein
MGAWELRKHHFSDQAKWLRYRSDRLRKYGMMGGLTTKLNRARERGDWETFTHTANSLIGWRQSEDRLRAMFHILIFRSCPPRVFWPIWLNWWSAVDRTGWWQQYLPVHFKRNGCARKYYDLETKEWHDALPDEITVYRGCDRKHVETGVSWTTDIEKAKFFATGGRYGLPGDPVIATGVIKKTSPNFFYVCPDRAESEIVCKPTIVDVESFDAKMHFKRMTDEGSEASEKAISGAG